MSDDPQADYDDAVKRLHQAEQDIADARERIRRLAEEKGV